MNERRKNKVNFSGEKELKEMNRGRSGFSILEILVTALIMVVVLIGLIRTFIYCSLLTHTSEGVGFVLTEAQDKLEEIRNHSYDLIVTDYSSGGSPGNKFDPSQVNGKGVIYIDSTNTDLLQIEIDVSWKDFSGRIIGEDINLNGTIDGAEDVNGNGKLDSTIKLISLIARK